MTNLRIFYTKEDNFPPYRVDVAELFDRALPYGIDVEWYRRRAKLGGCSVENIGEQQVHLPYFLGNKGTFWKVANKLPFWLCDIWQLLLFIAENGWRKYQELLQVAR